jgi:hypothetical protein
MEACSQEKSTSLLHRMVSLEDTKLKCLLKLLDGTRTRSELLEAMAAELPETPLAELEEGLEPCLQNFHRAGMLEA